MLHQVEVYKFSKAFTDWTNSFILLSHGNSGLIWMPNPGFGERGDYSQNSYSQIHPALQQISAHSTLELCL